MQYGERKQSLMSEVESEKIELFLSGKQIPAAFSFLMIYIQETNKPRKMCLRTKPASGQNADYPETLVTQYFFQVRQKIIVEVYGCDHSGKQQYLIGVVQSSVGEAFNGRSKGVMKEIVGKNNSTQGRILMRCEKVEKGNNKYVEFDVRARNLDVGHAFLCFGQSDSLFRLFKIKNGDQYLLLQSEVREGKNSLYAHVKISEKRLCNNNPKQPIIIRFYQDSNAPSSVGEARFDLDQIYQNYKHENLRLPLVKGGKQRGGVALERLKQTINYDFTDFIREGMQMALVLCIDFTASNGIQTSASSLHYTNGPKKKSQYEQAIHEVCNIVLDYDNDKLVPCFGFGAKVNMPNFNSQGKVHHCFPLNGSPENPNLFQLQGIEQGYRECLPRLAFGGPTYFAPLLQEAMNVCRHMKDQLKQYMILMILTDGVIHDKEEVMDLLVKCGRLPLSIIIIGIGNSEDWGIMNALDDDDCQMTDAQGNKTQRDLVQFVEFSKHNNNGVELAREVLEELPRQVQEYHQLIGVPPMAYRKNIQGTDAISQMKKK